MTSKSLKRRKTITHKKVRNHKKTRGGEMRHVPRGDGDVDPAPNSKVPFAIGVGFGLVILYVAKVAKVI
jgi:hypothetical protein